MIISCSTCIPFPRPLVYTTYRDKLTELVPYLPNVQRIEVKSHHKVDGLTHLVNEWHGSGEIPALARAVVSEAMLSWTDYAIWNDPEFTTEWRIETHAFTEAVRCVGKNRFLENGSSTLVESLGELTIDPKQIPGVPQFLARRVVKIVETFLSQRIEPNLLQVSEGVRRYLVEQGNTER